MQLTSMTYTGFRIVAQDKGVMEVDFELARDEGEQQKSLPV